MRHRRRSVRLHEYDYSWPGAYFITIRAYDQRHLFGKIVDGRLNVSDEGRIGQTVWDDLPRHYHHVMTDTFVIMPNHIHGIIVITEAGVGAGFKPAPTGTTKEFVRHGLPEIVRALKSFSARRINEWRGMPGRSVWQRGYYEHVIRNDESIDQIRAYITNNPKRWDVDEEHRQKMRRKGVVAEEALPWNT